MPEQNEETMRSLAEELKQQREQAGIPLSNIAESTKINARFLNAIDQGDLNCIEEPYMRIFVKTYAQQIGVDPAPILQRYDEIKGGQEELPVVKKSPVPSDAAVEATEERPSPFASNRTIGILALGLLFLIIVGVRLFGPEQEPPPTDISGPAEQTPLAPDLPESMTPQEEPAPQVSEDERSESASPRAAARDSLSLEATAVETTWVKVRADGANVFEDTLPQGRFEAWAARDTLELTLGKPMGLNLVLNRKPIPANWSPEGTLHLRITKQGVSVLSGAAIETSLDTTSAAGRE